MIYWILLWSYAYEHELSPSKTCKVCGSFPQYQLLLKVTLLVMVPTFTICIGCFWLLFTGNYSLHVIFFKSFLWGEKKIPVEIITKKWASSLCKLGTSPAELITSLQKAVSTPGGPTAFNAKILAGSSRLRLPEVRSPHLGAAMLHFLPVQLLCWEEGERKKR